MLVIVLDDYQRALDGAAALKRLEKIAEVRVFTEKIDSEDRLVKTLAGCQAIIPIRERTKFPASLLRRLNDLELISQTGNHAYHIDIDAATRAGIVVALAPGSNSTTELAIGLMLAIMRRIPQSDRAMRGGDWPLVLGYVLKGKTLGILGLGKIGTEVAAIGRAFGMNIVAWGPTLTAERAARSQVELLPLDEVLRTADIVSIHLALSNESKALIDERRLRLMKRSAYLVNTARGAIIDERALVRVLAEKAIAGAALDVFVEEPLPVGHPLLALDNVVLTPHLGWPTDAGFTGFAENAVANIVDYMDGKLTRALNPAALQYRDQRG
jgi:phosphoglycerate dehydrogenase-like enzyme